MTDPDAPLRDAFMADVEARANHLATMFRGEAPFPPADRPLTYEQQANEDRAAAVGMDRALRCEDWDDPRGEMADRASVEVYGR